MGDASEVEEVEDASEVKDAKELKEDNEPEESHVKKVCGVAHLSYGDLQPGGGGWSSDARLDKRAGDSGGTFVWDVEEFGSVVVRCFSETCDWVQAEVQRLCELEHPNLLKVLAYSADGPEVLLVTPLMRGASVDDAIMFSRKMYPWYKRVFCLQQVMHALTFLNWQGLCHGNLKGSNVLLSYDRCHACLSDSRKRQDAGSGVFDSFDSCEGMERALENDSFAFGILCLMLAVNEVAHNPRRHPKRPLLFDRRHDSWPDFQVWPASHATFLRTFSRLWTDPDPQNTTRLFSVEAENLLKPLLSEAEQEELEILMLSLPGGLTCAMPESAPSQSDDDRTLLPSEYPDSCRDEESLPDVPLPRSVF